MSNTSTRVNPIVFARAAICAAACVCVSVTASDAKAGPGPAVIRGIPTPAGAAPAPSEQPLAYLATFPNGTLQPSIDRLEAGAMQPGDTGIAGSNPTFTPLKGEFLVGITRPVDLPADDTPAATIWATPVEFGPGSILRIRATFIAPVGPLPGGGFAMGVGAKTGGKDDLPTEPRVFTTVNVRPGYLVRLNVPFGSVETTNTVLPAEIKDLIFSTTDPQPFTLELTIDRVHGTGASKLTVGDKVVGPLTFHLADFLADSGPVITAVGSGIAVNANGPGQTASVHVQDFRIYTSAGD
jgi:hypothetical protein